MWTWPRTIIHVDMDAFFAAVEQRDRPELRGKPIIVGGRAEERGVVSTASYEARVFGIHSAMPTAKALRLCPGVILVPPDHRRYQAVSQQVRAIFEHYCRVVEPLSIDEAFLDVTGEDSIAIAVGIKRDIATNLQLTASVGLSYNKFLAKLASDMDKPDGLTILTPERVRKQLPQLSVRDLPGIGQKTEAALHAIGVRKVADLLRADRGRLSQVLGKRVEDIISFAKGRDDRPVVTEHDVKSVGEETTFARDVRDRRHLAPVISGFAEDVWARVCAEQLVAYCVTVKCRYHDFVSVSRSQTVSQPLASAEEVFTVALTLLERLPDHGPIRLIGLQLSSLRPQDDNQQQRFQFEVRDTEK